MRAQDSNADGALDSGVAILNVGRSIGDEPYFMSQFIRMGLETMAIRSIERTLAQGQPAENALRTAQHLLQDEAAQPMLLFILRGERAGKHRELEALESGEVKFTEIYRTSKASWRDGPENYFGTQLMRHSHAYYLRILTELIEVARQSGDEQFPRVKKLLDDVAKTDLPVFVRNSVPIYGRATGAFRRNQAQLRCSIAALAAERYRRARGSWPASLAAVNAAGFLDHVPTDPYGGAPLRYRRLEDGWAIYSIGPDGNDGGGKMITRSAKTGNANIGFHLWDVGQRRQPPRNPVEAADPPKK